MSCKFKRLAAFIECSTGSTPTVTTVKRYLDLLEKMGYNELYLGCTDAYKIDGEPYFNYKRGGYTTADFKEMDAYARARGIELIASIQTLAHLSFVGRHHVYRQFFDTGDIMMVGDERTYEMIDKMFSAISKGLTTRRIHLGMDEAFSLGLGQYLKRNGYRPKREIMVEHLQRVTEIAKKYDYECEIWADMFTSNRGAGMGTDTTELGNEEFEKIPSNVKLISWDYDTKDKEKLRKIVGVARQLSDDTGYAGAAWKINGFAPFNAYSIERITAQMEVCHEAGVNDYIITMWSDAGGLVSVYSVLPTLFAAAEYAHGRWDGVGEPDKARFYDIVGRAYDDFMLLDYLNDPFKKNLTAKTTKSYWALFSDIFLGNYDVYLSEGNGEAYGKLSKEFAKMGQGKYGYIFQEAEALCRVLSVKAELGLKLRAAYAAKDKNTLQSLLEEELALLPEYFDEFVRRFERYWESENFSFGLEANHLIFGGQRERYAYCARKVKAYLEEGAPIEEIEGETLIPSIIPQITEDNCFEMSYRLLLSFCGM